MRRAGSGVLLLAGLALAGGGLLLDELVLVRLFRGAGLREGPILSAATLLLRVLLFEAGAAALLARSHPGPGILPPGPRGRLFARWMLLLAAAALAVPLLDRLVLGTRAAASVLAAAAAAAAIVVLARAAALLALGAFGLERRVPGLARPLLLLASVAAGALALESALAALAARPAPAAPAAGEVKVVMPDELARRDVEVPGAVHAWHWQGRLHVFDADGFRRTEPFAPKTPGVFRALALGDSLTYGQGVDAAEAWPAVLERLLRRTHRAEVLNLGVCGAQSTDVLGVLARHLDALDPDLVLFGACLNDFLPSLQSEYEHNEAWRIPFPRKAHFVERTRLGAWLAERWHHLLVRAGVRADFYTDILRDFRGYRARFAREVAEMSRLVSARGLPPVIAMVLTQIPDTAGPGQPIVETAERLLRDAGMRVVPSDYIRRHDGRRDLAVSRWEGHPNAEAHRIFAGELLATVLAEPSLSSYRLEASSGGDGK